MISSRLYIRFTHTRGRKPRAECLFCTCLLARERAIIVRGQNAGEREPRARAMTLVLILISANLINDTGHHVIIQLLRAVVAVAIFGCDCPSSPRYCGFHDDPRSVKQTKKGRKEGRKRGAPDDV